MVGPSTAIPSASLFMQTYLLSSPEVTQWTSLFQASRKGYAGPPVENRSVPPFSLPFSLDDLSPLSSGSSGPGRAIASTVELNGIPANNLEHFRDC